MDVICRILGRKLLGAKFFGRDRENLLMWGSLRLAAIKYNVTESGINTTV